jgi:ferric-dicitrate binding protein FerR (iron transport regulator)
MSAQAKLAYETWRKADAEAREAETRLREAWERYDSREGEPPSADLMAEVSRLRATASDKLTAAMMYMGATDRQR